jgi:hypothetical protein
LPDQFLLEIPLRNKTYRTELRWKSRGAAEVKFLDEVAHSPAAASIDQLHTEIALLRRRNAEMAAQLTAMGFSEWVDDPAVVCAATLQPPLASALC